MADNLLNYDLDVWIRLDQEGKSISREDRNIGNIKVKFLPIIYRLVI